MGEKFGENFSLTEIQPVETESQRADERKKIWLLPTLIILFSTGLTIFGADFALRLFSRELLYYRPNEMFLDKWPSLPLVSRYKKNAHYDGEVYGDLAAMQSNANLREVRRVVFDTDAFGFRNSTALPTDDAYDLIVLGDSFGAGLGTTQNRTWVSQLQGRYGVNTYNLSIPGGSPWQSYVLFASEADRLTVHPGSVVLVTIFSGNDLDDYYYEKDVAFSELPWNSAWQSFGVRVNSFVKRSPVLQLIKRLRHGNSSENNVLIRKLPGGRTMLFYEPYVARRNRTEAIVRDHQSYPKLISAICGIKNVAAKHGLTVAVALFPSKEQVYGWLVDETPPWGKAPGPNGLGEALKASCKENGLAFTDLTSSLGQAAQNVWKKSGDVIYWTDDTHWNEKGHGIVADIISKTICIPSLNAGPKTAKTICAITEKY